MRGHQPNGEWTKFWQRKNRNTFQSNKELINYYVSGLANGIGKEELHEPFSRLEKVINMYFGLKKDFHKRNFAFVRYANIRDVKEMKLKLQSIKCGGKTLEVNISKQQRKTQQLKRIVIEI